MQRCHVTFNTQFGQDALHPVSIISKRTLAYPVNQNKSRLANSMMVCNGSLSIVRTLVNVANGCVPLEITSGPIE